MDLIEPSHFDAVVVTSGLPEVLIASALARAGQSVLVLDAADSYGGSWASLSGPDFVHQLINQQLKLQQQQAGTGEPQTPPAAASAEADPAGSGAVSVPLQPVAPLAGASGVSLHTHPRLQEALSARGLIIDLAPKVLYQDEALVQLLVSCQAHNYLEFKLVEGSYIFQGGRLSRVAASRADLFSDKSLSLADKRSLGRFLTGCMEAQQGLGRLKDAFNQQPLVELLQAEGLSRQLQDTVLYGIAMADTQQQQQQDGTGNPASAISSSSSSSSSSSGLLTAAEGLAALQLYSSSLGRYGGSGAFMAPCYGCGSLPEAFVRLAAVQGAVMALRYAATQLLLPPAAGQPKAAEVGEAGKGGSGAGSQASAASAEPAGDSTAAQPGRRAQVVLASGQRLTADVVVCCQASTGSSSSSSSSSDAEMPGPAAESTVAVARAVAVMEGSVVGDEGSLLLVFPPGSLGAAQAAVIRGLQLGPSLAVAPPGRSLLYLSVVLDSCSSCSGAADGSSAVAEQVLRPALSAIASLEGLSAMRLSSSSSSSSDEEEGDPRAEEAAPSSSGGGDTATAAPAAAADKPSAAPVTSAEAAAASPAAEETAAGAYEPAAAAAAAAAAGSRPQVLAAAFFTTHQPAAQQQRHSQPAAAAAHQQQGDQQQQPGAAPAPTAASAPGDAVLWCPAAPTGLISYQQPVQEAEAAFRQRFPQLPWLTDPVRPRQPAGAPVAAAAASSGAGGEDGQGQPGAGDVAGSSSSGEAADAGAGQAKDAQRGDMQSGGGGGVLDDDELDAIDELTAALAQLSAPLDAAAATQ